MANDYQSPRNKRIAYRNGAYRYENVDGSSYYNDGNGFEEYRHPDASRNWTRSDALDQPAIDDEDVGVYAQDFTNADDDRYEGDYGDGYGQPAFQQDTAEYGYDDDPDRMDLDEPPPYSEYDPMPAQQRPPETRAPPSRPKQTARAPVGKSKIAKSGAATKVKAEKPAQTAGKKPTATTSARTTKTLKPIPIKKENPIKKEIPIKKEAKAEAKPAKEPKKAAQNKAEAKKPAAKKAEPKRIELQAEKKCTQCREPGHDRRSCPLNEIKHLMGGNYSHSHHTTTTSTTTTTTTTKSSSVNKGAVMTGRVTKAKPNPKAKSNAKPAAKPKTVKSKK